MWWQCGDPVCGFGDIDRSKRLGSLIDSSSFCIVALEAHIRKLSATAQARRDIAGADTSTNQVGTQIQSELIDKCLGRAIDIAARVSSGTGNRTNIDDHTILTLHEMRQQSARHADQAFVVGLNHDFPIIEIRLLCRCDSQSEASVIDQNIDVTPFGAQRFQQAPRSQGPAPTGAMAEAFARLKAR